jgi:UDP-3-O-[3-hydroxymyristoyl] glucosamine N-acyltransferase
MHFNEISTYDNTFTLHFGEVQGVINSISHIVKPLENTFCFLKNKKYLKQLGKKSSHNKFPSTGLILAEDLFDDLQKNYPTELEVLEKQFAWLATVKSVDFAMVKLTKHFYDEKYNILNFQVDGRQLGTVEIDASSYIAQNVHIGENVRIEKNVKIMSGVVIRSHVIIGEGSIIFPNVVIYPFSTIGRNCRIHAGTVLGADGFGYNFFEGIHQKVWHLHGVEIGDDVEIGANSTIDGGAFHPTTIGMGTKIDNGVTIGHNVFIGNNCILCGQVAISGSAELEDYVIMGGKSGVGPGALVGKGSQIAGQAMVMENAFWPAGSKIGGHPGRDLNEWLRSIAVLRKLSKRN